MFSSGFTDVTEYVAKGPLWVGSGTKDSELVGEAVAGRQRIDLAGVGTIDSDVADYGCPEALPNFMGGTSAAVSGAAWAFG